MKITQNSQILNAASFFIAVHHSWTYALVHYEYAITDIYTKTTKSVWPQNFRVTRNGCNNSSMTKILKTAIQVNLVPGPSETWRLTHKFICKFCH